MLFPILYPELSYKEGEVVFLKAIRWYLKKVAIFGRWAPRLLASSWASISNSIISPYVSECFIYFHMLKLRLEHQTRRGWFDNENETSQRQFSVFYSHTAQAAHITTVM